jgi:hypothetical protein
LEAVITLVTLQAGGGTADDPGEPIAHFIAYLEEAFGLAALAAPPTCGSSSSRKYISLSL